MGCLGSIADEMPGKYVMQHKCDLKTCEVKRKFNMVQFLKRIPTCRSQFIENITYGHHPSHAICL